MTASSLGLHVSLSHTDGLKSNCLALIMVVPLQSKGWPTMPNGCNMTIQPWLFKKDAKSLEFHLIMPNIVIENPRRYMVVD